MGGTSFNQGGLGGRSPTAGSPGFNGWLYFRRSDTAHKDVGGFHSAAKDDSCVFMHDGRPQGTAALANNHAGDKPVGATRG